MTLVTFRAIDGEASILGAERRHLASLAREVTQAMLGLESPNLEHARERCRRMRLLLNPAHYLAAIPREANPTTEQERVDLSRFAYAFQTCLSIGDPKMLQWRGRPIDTFALALNTAMAIGGDGLCLAARIEAQCEIHGWVDGKNRAWLAGIIERSVRSGMFRELTGDGESAVGWDAVVRLLESSHRGEVVASFSAADEFPNSYLAGVGMDVYDDLPREQRKRKLWRPAMRALRDRPLLEWKPGDWSRYRFDHGLSALDLTADDWERRVDTAMTTGGQA